MDDSKRPLSAKIFNGYVHEPIPMFILMLFPAIAVLALALWATWDFLSFTIFDYHVEEIVCMINEYHAKGSDYELMSSSGLIFSLPVESVEHTEVIDTLVTEGSSILVKYTERQESDIYVFDVIEILYPTGTIIISEDTIKDVQQTEWIRVLAWLWGMCIVYFIFFIGVNYILCNAPRYPRMASLIIRESWRNF